MRTFAFLALLCSCGTRLRGIASDLSVEPGRLDFAGTAVGEQRALPLQLTNGSRAPLDLHLKADAPFVLELDVHLGGGASQTVDVAFAPSQLGAAAGALAVSGDVALEVPLTGEGIAAAECQSASSCRLSHRDPATNA